MRMNGNDLDEEYKQERRKEFLSNTFISCFDFTKHISKRIRLLVTITIILIAVMQLYLIVDFIDKSGYTHNIFGGVSFLLHFDSTYSAVMVESVFTFFLVMYSVVAVIRLKYEGYIASLNK